MTISDRLEMDDAQSLTQIYIDNPKYQEIEGDYEGLQSRNSKIFIRCCDITTVQTDAIVCPSQTNFLDPPYGLCAAVWARGGPVLKQTCLEKEKLNAGSAFLADGYRLPSKYAIFTAAPTPDAPYSYEERLGILRNNYTSSLDVVRRNDDIRTVAFPCLGTGGGGIQLQDANRVAARAIRDWLEDDDNRRSVDVILLCMFCDDQWDDFIPELLKAFPYGLDLKGNNLEELRDVPDKHLALPRGSTSTSIMCFMYQQTARKQINRHFHTIVDTIGETLKTDLALRRRFRNCVIFKQKHPFEHQVIILHSKDMNLIEVQVTRFSDHVETIRADICERLQAGITEYFQSNLENITNCQLHLRCHESSWGQETGLWKFDEVQAMSGRSAACDKHDHAAEYHHVLRSDLVGHWNIMAGDLSPRAERARQHDHRQPVELSMPLSDYTVKSSTSTTETTLTGKRSDQSSSFDVAGRCQFSSPDATDRFKPTSESSHDATNPKLYANPGSPIEHSDDTTSMSTSRKQPSRKKAKLNERIKSSKTTGQEQTRCSVVAQTETQIHELLRRSDSGNETTSDYNECRSSSRFSSQISTQSRGLKLSKPCRELKNHEILKLAKQMGSHQRKVGLYLELTDTDIDNAIARAEKDSELNGYYIIKKWIANNEDKANIATLLEVFRECDIDTYHLKQEFGIS